MATIVLAIQPPHPVACDTTTYRWLPHAAAKLRKVLGKQTKR